MTAHRPQESRQNQTVPQSNTPRPQNKDKIDSRKNQEATPNQDPFEDDQEVQPQEPDLVDQKGPANKSE